MFDFNQEIVDSMQKKVTMYIAGNYISNFVI